MLLATLEIYVGYWRGSVLRSVWAIAARAFEAHCGSFGCLMPLPQYLGGSPDDNGGQKR
ncbi:MULTISPECIES: hypothetical protein [Cyanophyceae]|uniref:Uncharacterized protein n=1 Tax=Leptolyngbya subtilissima DQ-A4 TaxID=2933933 RepID=A0ABV0K855_9CYAN|nr:hypothetical protein [Nodosilinea sp. FACHB-141]MBD2110637.1 hypothetical protein [Nodosilinea sp. FACHB-141]